MPIYGIDTIWNTSERREYWKMKKSSKIVVCTSTAQKLAQTAAGMVKTENWKGSSSGHFCTVRV